MSPHRIAIIILVVVLFAAANGSRALPIEGFREHYARGNALVRESAALVRRP